MTPRYVLPTVLAICALGLPACDWMPGRPKKADRWVAPEEVADFGKLYAGNCLGCHGLGGVTGASIAMDNPVFLSVIPRETLSEVVSKGVHGTAMPGFSKAAGGTLTKEQIEIIVNSLIAKKPAVPPGAALPPYSAPLGDVARGAQVFAASCASCHGAAGDGGDKARSVVNAAFLGLVSDQYLRTIAIAGRPDLGCPDFANRTPGKPMTDADISDVTAWLVSHRKNEFGQPLVAPQGNPQP
jgi:mono/diheme cytochrome c family protein